MSTDDGAVADGSARLFVSVSRLGRVLRKNSPSGLGPGATSALSVVVKCGPLRAGDLAAREGVSAPTMTRIVAVLVGEGYVTKEADPDDARASLLAATEEGVRMVREVGSARSEVLLDRVRRLPPDQLSALLAALPALETLAGD